MRRRAFAGLLAVCALAACGRRRRLIPAVPPTATLVQFARIINEQAAINHVPPGLIGAIIVVESGGNPRATGASGSMGLMQLKPATAARYGITDLYNPAANIAAGARYLRDLLARFRGNIPFALAAYTAGSAAIAAAGGIPPANRGYVDRVLTVYNALPR